MTYSSSLDAFVSNLGTEGGALYIYSVGHILHSLLHVHASRCTLLFSSHDVCSAGQLYAASDVQEVAEYMHGVFTTSTPQLKPTGHLSGLLDGPTSTEPPSPELQSIWLDKNPLGVPTEREVHALEQGVDIHRFLLQKAHA